MKGMHANVNLGWILHSFTLNMVIYAKEQKSYTHKRGAMYSSPTRCAEADPLSASFVKEKLLWLKRCVWVAPVEGRVMEQGVRQLLKAGGAREVGGGLFSDSRRIPGRRPIDRGRRSCRDHGLPSHGWSFPLGG